MNRKDQFLRAIQLVPHRQTVDLPLAFRLALNLDERSIPQDLHGGAREFVTQISARNAAKLTLWIKRKNNRELPLAYVRQEV